MRVGMGYKKGFPDPGNSQAEAKRNKRNGNEPRTMSVVEQFSEEQVIMGQSFYSFAIDSQQISRYLRDLALGH
jgi:hypothetical protein